MSKIKHSQARKLIKRNEMQELLNSIMDYYKKNTENAIITAVVVVLVLVAVPLVMNGRKQSAEKAAALLSQASRYMNSPVVDMENATLYGFFRTETEKSDKVIATYNEIMQKYRGTTAAKLSYIGLADAYYAKGSYKEALDYYKSFADKFKGNAFYAEACSGAGYASFGLGDYKGAASWFEKALSVNPSDNDALLRLSESYIMMNDKAKAKENLEKVAKNSEEGSYWAVAASEKLKGIN